MSAAQYTFENHGNKKASAHEYSLLLMISYKYNMAFEMRTDAHAFDHFEDCMNPFVFAANLSRIGAVRAVQIRAVRVQVASRLLELCAQHVAKRGQQNEQHRYDCHHLQHI